MGRVRVERARRRAASAWRVVGIGAVLLAVPLLPIAPAAAVPPTARPDRRGHPGRDHSVQRRSPVSRTAPGLDRRGGRRDPGRELQPWARPAGVPRVHARRSGQRREYRADPHDIDIFTAGGGNFYIRSSSPQRVERPAAQLPELRHVVQRLREVLVHGRDVPAGTRSPPPLGTGSSRRGSTTSTRACHRASGAPGRTRSSCRRYISPPGPRTC